ncbi:hypothetical protein BDR26DRAFT_856411 [Obelidium mucronatum]|nr:hypothetical protein BDR26DRAFT_856411 [Obelidium mucronatum]
MAAAGGDGEEYGDVDRELDAFMRGHEVSDMDERERQSLLSGASYPSQPTSTMSSTTTTTTTTTSNAFQETRNKLNERGEMLSNMERKFADLDRGASDFLNTIKEYNARQEAKKWYEL